MLNVGPAQMGVFMEEMKGRYKALAKEMGIVKK
jgi:hypothetical protein